MRPLLLLLVVLACSSHANETEKPAATATEPLPQPPEVIGRQAAHSGPVVVLPSGASLPATIRFAVIERVKVRVGGYKDAEEVLYLRLAQRARAVGADAVVDVTMWRQPAGFSWAAPHADGTAVRILERDKAGDLTRFGKQY